MGDFNWTEGTTNRAGKIGTVPNLIEPQKRMLSSQSPFIVTRDGKAFLITGSPGGRTIINTVFSIILNTLEFEMDLPAATAAPRLHHQWQPDEVRFEGSGDARYGKLIEHLERMGHHVGRGNSKQGDAHSIRVDWSTDKLQGAADTRIDGKAAGY